MGSTQLGTSGRGVKRLQAGHPRRKKRCFSIKSPQGLVEAAPWIQTPQCFQSAAEQRSAREWGVGRTWAVSETHRQIDM